MLSWHLVHDADDRDERSTLNPDELSRLIDAHAAPLELYARQWCDDFSDVVQEAFVRLIEQQQHPNHPVAWLYRVVRNAALMQQRSDRRRRNHEASASRSTREWFEPTTGETLDEEQATRALEDISEECREVVIARIWGKLTFEEISELTNTSSSTAHRRYRDGLKQLRKKLGVTCQND